MMAGVSPVMVQFGDQTVPVVAADTVVVGTGSAGYCAAVRLAQFGRPDVVMVTDNIRAGTSRNAGSDKQTYYKLTLSGAAGDSVRQMAETLYDGGAMDGDHALAEAAGSARSFLHLVELGVDFPHNPAGEFVGYKTDHDPRQRATSVGPRTSRAMVERLEARALASGVAVLDGCRVVDLITVPAATGRRLAGVLVRRPPKRGRPTGSPWLLVRCANLVYASGGPAGLYATSVYPHGQWGASGAAYRAGVSGKNVTEWQFGLASLRPRWNVSGSYLQVVPRLISTDAAGGDEREFLAQAIADPGAVATLTFLKGYQWPFDIRKASAGSSLIDLLVYRETVLRGRRVFLDFRANPGLGEFDSALLSPEAYDYLARADALGGTPAERLRRLNEPAYQFYRQQNPAVDLAATPLEIDVCVQHNNGGLLVDDWWESNLPGLFAVGEAAGAHGVYRPGGAALNSGQVGATRAAERIAARHDQPVDEAVFAAAAGPVLAQAGALVEAATRRAGDGAPDNTGQLLDDLQQLMSRQAGLVRSPDSVAKALQQVEDWLADLADTVVADGGSRRSLDRVFLLRDILTTAVVYLSAMVDYLAHGGRSRGSVLYTDPTGDLPEVPGGGTSDLPELFRYRLDGGALDGEIQEVGWAADGGAGVVSRRWRPRRPIPEPDEVFETVWRNFRQG